MELPTTTALLVVDVQEGHKEPDHGPRNNPQAEENIARLLGAWRDARRPIIHVKDNSRRPTSPFHPSHPGNAIQGFALPASGETLIEKDVNCAFIGTDLESRLRDSGITSLVVVGLVTNHCVESTVRMAGDLGFDTLVVSDATATFDRIGPDGQVFEAELVHAVSLTNMRDEYARVVDTQEVLQRFESAAEV